MDGYRLRRPMYNPGFSIMFSLAKSIDYRDSCGPYMYMCGDVFTHRCTIGALLGYPSPGGSKMYLSRLGPAVLKFLF